MKSFNEIHSDLEKIFKDAFAGKLLDRPKEFDELCERAAKNRSKTPPGGVEAWAKKLAKSMSKFTD